MSTAGTALKNNKKVKAKPLRKKQSKDNIVELDDLVKNR